MSDDRRANEVEADAGTEVRISEREAEEMRTRVRGLARDINRTTWEVARILYLLWADDRHIERWGYRSWSAWAEDTGINRRKAEYLRQLYEWFSVRQPLNTFVLARLTKLEWTKARLLARYGVTSEEALEWISVAEAETREALEEKLKSRSRERVQEPEAPARTTGEVFRQRRFSLAHAENDDASQWSIVEQALRSASSICGSDKDGHLLTMVCIDFLATNGIQQSDPAAALKYVAKIEQLMGKSLVVVDTVEGHIEYGVDVLRSLAAGSEEDDGASSC